MAQTLLEFAAPVAGPDGMMYRARACAAPVDGGTWHGWLEFDPVESGQASLRSPRETTQPKLKDAEYWATGLTAIYLEGALARALKPASLGSPPPAKPPKFDEPAPSAAVLDPFSVYEKDEALLRRHGK